MKLHELKAEELRKELAERGLKTSGQKAELQLRLIAALEDQGLSADECDFQGEQSGKLDVKEGEAEVPVASLMTMMQQLTLKTDVQAEKS